MAFSLMARTKRAAATASIRGSKGKSALGRRAVNARPEFESPVLRPQWAALPMMPGIQTRLKVGEPNDRFEQEADRVADEVVRTPGGTPGSRSSLSTQADRISGLNGPGPVRPELSGALGHAGRGLPQPVRAFFESNLGRDFSRVRIHTDDRAAMLARALNARAFTAGHDVVFGAGEYAPQTEEGKRLLTHELAHVAQQGRRQTDSPAVQCQKDDEKESGKEKPKVKPGPKAKAEPKWTRKLESRPSLLDGRKPSYDITFNHVLPTPPKGVTQLWQVVEIEKHILTDKCKEEAENEFRVDIVDIDKRAKIKDQWFWIRRDDPCFAVEVNHATVGFDDQQSGFAEQTSVRVSEADARDLLSKMVEPKGTYSGVYTFVKNENCPDCSKLSELQKKHGAPNGEALKIAGVGEWKS